VCTLSWLESESGLEIFFNRDERNTRGPELPPRIDFSQGTRFISPRDSDQGGTWVGVNEHGLVGGLLNGYRSGDLELLDPRSRGSLVVDAMAYADSESAVNALRASNLSRFRSFVLALLRPGSAPVVAEWDRNRLMVDEDASRRWPLISSSVAGPEVDVARRAVFHSLVAPSSQDLVRAHQSHLNGPSAYSVCMHRVDGRTRSFTRIAVESRQVRLAWSPDSPCTEAKATLLELPRVSVS